jgi:hypothetical protein
MIQPGSARDRPPSSPAAAVQIGGRLDFRSVQHRPKLSSLAADSEKLTASKGRPYDRKRVAARHPARPMAEAGS